MQNSPDTDSTAKPRGLLRGVARGIALFFGGFTFLNLLGEFLHSGFDATIWWINLRPLADAYSTALLIPVAGLLLFVAWRGGFHTRLGRLIFVAAMTALILASVRDALSFYWLLAASSIGASFPASFSVFVGLSLLLVLLGTRHQPERSGDSTKTPHREKFALATAFAVWMAGFPLLQIHCFGWTDYRRPADVAVVFGCRVYRSGNLSPPLADRVRSAAQLYEQGLVRYLIMSGGPGMGDVHETDAMRRFAVELGVPVERILIDREGLSTSATIRNTLPLIREHNFRRILAVSNYYHLPRIKLCFQRAGQQVFTVPSCHTFGLRMRSWQLAREVVALWAYYLEPVTRVRLG
ncbi:MAG: YdcF family protein [Planctomycetes bacterium]|nr:YdcF family protein [Planctomycetota bacterium]